MARALRVVQVIEKNRLTTGSVVQMLEAARGLAARGHEVTVAGPAGGDLKTACVAARLPFFELPLEGLAGPTSIVRLRKQLRRLKPQILHAHKGRAHSVGLLSATGTGRLPRLVVNRGVSFPLDIFNKWKYRHPRVGAIVCVADAVKEIVVRTAGIRERRVHTVFGGTDCTLFDPNRANGERVRSELNLDRTHLLIGQVSVRNWKGWTDLVAAFARLGPHIADSRLVLVGCEPESARQMVERTVREVGLAGRVIALPYRSDMPEVLAACDVVVDASWAGTGITGTIREAMAMARAVVATDCGGNRELVLDCEVGLVVPARDIDALAGALRRLLEDPALRLRLGTAARRRVVNHFSMERRIEELESLYREILR